MANIKISQLPQAPNVSTATTLAVVQSGTTYQATLAQVSTAIAAPANAETLTGTFLAGNVINSSLQTVGVMTGLSVSGGVQVNGNISANTNISATGNATVGNILTAGLISATGNATVGNLLTAGLISATGNATAGNLLTSGLISATGNATAGNLLTSGLISATSTITSAANISGSNILTAGLISATGNIIGSNVNATSINKVTITAPATSSTLTVADGKTFTASNTLTLTGTDATSFTFPGTSDTVATLAASQTLTNKRVNPRTLSTTSTATLTPDISAYDQLNLTAQAVSLTVAAPTGTPVDGNKLVIRILDNGTPQTITWNATYTVIGVTLPTTTTANKMVYIGCVYNSTNTRWDVVAVSTQA